MSPATTAEPRFAGTLVLMSGSAELEVPNDEAVASFWLETQDADPARAQSQLNQKVAEGIAALKRADPQGQVESGGYSASPVYAPGGRKIVAWRARQVVSLRTGELAGLARTVAAAQSTLALGGLSFRVSRAGRERVEADLIQRAVANLNARVAAAAQSMGVAAARIRTEELNFGVVDRPAMAPMAMMAARGAMAEAVAEPSFEPGSSTQQMTVTARVRFLAP